MARLLVFALVAFSVWYIWQYIKTRSPAERSKLMKTWGILALILISVGLVATGRMHWIGAAIAASIPFLRTAVMLLARATPLLRFWHQRTGKPSRIRTSGLEVWINFASGETGGQVFTGPHAGVDLADLGESELKEQYAFFQHQDRQSALLLRAYILRRGFTSFGGGAEDSPPPGTDISEKEAWQILGLEPGASREEIIKAHKRLIQKLHPDRGGNDYLAAKINAAKDRLVS